MRLITQLKGTPTEGEFTERRGAITALHLTPAPGFFWRATLGPAGFVLSTTAGEAAAIPLDELTRLCCEANPQLRPATGPALTSEATPPPVAANVSSRTSKPRNP